MDTRRGEAPRGHEPARGHEAPDADVADAAVFALERIPRGKGLRPAAGIIAVIAAVAAYGLLTAGHPAPGVAALDARVAPNAGTKVATAAPAATDRPADVPRDWGSPKKGDDLIAAPLLAVEANASDGLVFVHGDVYTRGASFVVVSISDEQHRTLDVRALNMPGGSTAFRTGPNDRFSVAFRLLDPLSTQPAWVSAEAYDRGGAIIATARTAVTHS